MARQLNLSSPARSAISTRSTRRTSSIASPTPTPTPRGRSTRKSAGSAIEDPKDALEEFLKQQRAESRRKSKASTARVSGLDNGPPAKQLALSAAASSTQLGPCEIPETQYPDAVQGSATTSVESEVAGGVGDAEGAGSPEEEIFHDALQLAGETEDTKFGILDPFTDNEEERRLDGEDGGEDGVASEVDEEEGEPAWRRTGIVADSMATGTEQEESDIDDDRASPLPPKWSRHHPDNRHSSPTESPPPSANFPVSSPVAYHSPSPRSSPIPPSSPVNETSSMTFQNDSFPYGQRQVEHSEEAEDEEEGEEVDVKVMQRRRIVLGKNSNLVYNIDV